MDYELESIWPSRRDDEIHSVISCRTVINPNAPAVDTRSSPTFKLPSLRRVVDGKVVLKPSSERFVDDSVDLPAIEIVDDAPDFGPQKGPSSLAKIQAETKFVLNRLAEIEEKDCHNG